MKIILSSVLVCSAATHAGAHNNKTPHTAPCFQQSRSHYRKLGVYHPQCTTDGFYAAKQCHGSTGYCWCVDQNGVHLQKAVPPGHPLQCDWIEPTLGPPPVPSSSEAGHGGRSGTPSTVRMHTSPTLSVLMTTMRGLDHSSSNTMTCVHVMKK